MFSILGDIRDWLFNGIYEFATETAAFLIEWYVIGVIKFKIFMAQFAWDIASNILANLGLSQALNSAFASLDGSLISYLTFFRLPEAVSILMQALVTKFTLRLIL